MSNFYFRDSVFLGVTQPYGESSVTEGIGNARITANIEDMRTQFEDAISISDGQAVTMLFRILRDEGIFLGSITSPFHLRKYL